MLIQEEYIKTATKYLTILATYTESMSSLNLHDCSVISENFFSKLLNIIYGYELKNINLVEHNATAIDLYDSKSRVSVQVTSTKTLNKVKDCLTKFREKELYKAYDKLFIYVLTKKQKSYKIETINEGGFEFDGTIHILDKNDLLKKFLELDSAIQKEVVDILQAGIKLPAENEPLISNEVMTIISLITLLSNNVSDEPFDEASVIDPNSKIIKRFKKKAEMIEDQYFELCTIYEPILSAIETSNDIDSVKHSKVSAYLKDHSTRLLIENDRDAMKAFDILLEEVISLFKNSGVNYDEMAVKFFLLKSLTQCNVFPLLRSELSV